MNRNYELMFIVRPDMVDEDLNKLISTLESSVTSAGGTAKAEVWGKRRLRVTEQVIKFLTVRTDEELKRLDKIKKIRDSKKKVSAAPAAPAPASVTPEAGTEPAPTAV